jgi:hypothetical protein
MNQGLILSEDQDPGYEVAPSPSKTSANPSTHFPPNPHTLSVHNTQSQNTPYSKFRSSSFSLHSPSSSTGPKNPVTEHRHGDYPQLAVYLSTVIVTLFFLIFCVKCKLYTCCHRRTQENENAVMATVGNITRNSSDSSNEVYSVTSV